MQKASSPAILEHRLSSLRSLGVCLSMANADHKRNRATLVLGLGNDILTDDAIGLLVVRRLAEVFQGNPAFEFQETTEMGLALLDFMEGREGVILIDSIQTGEVNPGVVRELAPQSLAQISASTPHFLGVAETLALGAELGLSMPAKVRVFAIEVADAFTIGNTLTPALQSALPVLVTQLSAALLESGPLKMLPPPSSQLSPSRPVTPGQ